jgi:tetrahydromethanopterin S-methyltransferase subunit B
VAGDHPLLQDLGGYLGTQPGFRGPVFEVTDPQATPLACYPGSKSVSVAARDFGTYKTVFIGCVGLSDRFLHNLARWSGCWRVAPPGDAVYASESFLTVHALMPGHKHLQLARSSRVTDLTTNAVTAKQTDTVELDMKRGETRWFFLERP